MYRLVGYSVLFAVIITAAVFFTCHDVHFRKSWLEGIRADGRAAGRDGIPVEACPHTSSWGGEREARQFWLKGWMDGWRERRKVREAKQP